MGVGTGTSHIRVLGFASIYFLAYIVLFSIYSLYLVESHMTIYSYVLNWVLMHPELALRMIYTELTRSPLSLFVVMLCSSVLGFVTDQVLRITIRRQK